KIDAAIVLSNVLTLMRVFAIPILISEKFEGATYQIRYKFTTKVEDMVA
ncbi:IS5/IS1182 family transposase, partial [Enterococcus avium]|nr:IS5/IS1182 family transposase [Enterococcus avium]